MQVTNKLFSSQARVGFQREDTFFEKYALSGLKRKTEFFLEEDTVVLLGDTLISRNQTVDLDSLHVDKNNCVIYLFHKHYEKIRLSLFLGEHQFRLPSANAAVGAYSLVAYLCLGMGVTSTDYKRLIKNFDSSATYNEVSELLTNVKDSWVDVINLVQPYLKSDLTAEENVAILNGKAKKEIISKFRTIDIQDYLNFGFSMTSGIDLIFKANPLRNTDESKNKIADAITQNEIDNIRNNSAQTGATLTCPYCKSVVKADTYCSKCGSKLK